MRTTPVRAPPPLLSPPRRRRHHLCRRRPSLPRGRAVPPIALWRGRHAATRRRGLPPASPRLLESLRGQAAALLGGAGSRGEKGGAGGGEGSLHPNLFPRRGGSALAPSPPFRPVRAVDMGADRRRRQRPRPPPRLRGRTCGCVGPFQVRNSPLPPLHRSLLGGAVGTVAAARPGRPPRAVGQAWVAGCPAAARRQRDAAQRCQWAGVNGAGGVHTRTAAWGEPIRPRAAPLSVSPPRGQILLMFQVSRERQSFAAEVVGYKIGEYGGIRFSPVITSTSVIKKSQEVIPSKKWTCSKTERNVECLCSTSQGRA